MVLICVPGLRANLFLFQPFSHAGAFCCARMEGICLMTSCARGGLIVGALALARRGFHGNALCLRVPGKTPVASAIDLFIELPLASADDYGVFDFSRALTAYSCCSLVLRYTTY